VAETYLAPLLFYLQNAKAALKRAAFITNDVAALLNHLVYFVECCLRVFHASSPIEIFDEEQKYRNFGFSGENEVLR
jgi:hypothetical protein